MVYVMSEQMECVGDMQVRIAWALCVVHVRLERSAEGVPSRCGQCPHARMRSSGAACLTWALHTATTVKALLSNCCLLVEPRHKSRTLEAPAAYRGTSRFAW